MREALTIIWRLAAVTELILVARLLLQGLAGVYPALVTCSCVFAFQALLLHVSLSQRHSMIQQVWKVTEPLSWVLCSWMVLELFSKWTRSYPGIGRFGRLLFGALISIALVFSLIWWPFEWKALVFDHDFRIYYILNRVFLATQALFVLSVWLFFRNYPAPVAPNVFRHTHITMTYFAMNALSWLVFTLNGLKVATLMNFSIVVVTIGCFSAWAILLTRKGEERETMPLVSPEDAARIERVNQELLGLMKNFPG